MKTKLSELIAPSFYDLHKLLKKNIYREFWLKGGRGSTKSTFISIEIILGMLKDRNANAVVLRRYHNELRDTVYGQFIWTITRMGIEDYFKFQVAPMQIIYLPTHQKIIFKGADNPKKLKSINVGRGYVKYVWFEEADQFSGMEEIRSVIQSLFRGGNKHRIAFYSFNPPKSSRAWVNKEVKIIKEGRIVHHSTYLEVPRDWLGETFIAEAEHLRAVNPTAYRHEYLGEEVGTGLEVFNNINARRITDEEIKAFDKIRQGLDFGYATDPVAFVKMHYDKTRRRLYIFHEVTGVGISNRQLAGKLTAEEKRRLTIADSSEPKSIDELKYDYGMNVIGAKKGAGSVEYGIKFLQDLEEIIIDPTRCPRAYNEFINYALEQNRNGEVINKFPDSDNHTIDAVRYALEHDMSKRKITSTSNISLRW